MTDRLKGVSVTFTDDIRDDAAEAIIKYPTQLSDGVANMLQYDPGGHTGDRLMAFWIANEGLRLVGPILADYRDVMAEQRVRDDLGKELMEIVYPTSHSDGCPAKTDVRANCAVLCRRYRRKGG